MAGVENVSRGAVEVAKKAKPAAERVDSPKGLAAAGVALIALPYAAKGVAKLVGGGNGGTKVAEAGEKAKKGTTKAGKQAVGEAARQKLTPSVPRPLKKAFGGDESSGESNGAAAGHGSGRRMPIQQAVDVALPITETYNLWTDFENWPAFMHRVDQVDQVDDAKVAISTKIWGITRRSQAQIVEQHPDERIQWDAQGGPTHTGIATFHKLAPRLTRVDVTIDVEPQGMLEKMGRGMRFTKRAVRGDLHRFKAFAELHEDEGGSGWRGTIEGGEVKRKTERRSGGSKSKRRSSSRSRSRNGSGSSSSRSKSRSSGSRS